MKTKKTEVSKQTLIGLIAFRLSHLRKDLKTNFKIEDINLRENREFIFEKEINELNDLLERIQKEDL